MKNIVAGRVIANDKKGRPILVEPEKWNAILDLKKGLLKLQYSGTRCEYDLTRDTMCLAIRDSKKEAAVGRTIGRMAMTGIATSLLSQNKGMGGALMDLRILGTEKNTVLMMFLVMKDSTTIYLEGYSSDFESLRKFVPNEAIGENAQSAAGNMLDLAARMERDGPRVLGELDQKVQMLMEEYDKSKNEAENGTSFEVRDAARTRADEIKKEIENIKNLGKLVTYRLDSKNNKSNTSSSGSGWSKFLKYSLAGLAGLLVLITLIGLISGNSNKDSNNGTASIPASSAKAMAPIDMQAAAKMGHESVNDHPTVDLPSQSGTDDRSIAQQTHAIQNPESSKPLPAENVDAAITSKPSFDCEKASTATEKLICSNAPLGEADALMATRYRISLAASNDKDTFRADQRQWQKNVRDICSNATCIAEAYQTRLAQLK